MIHFNQNRKIPHPPRYDRELGLWITYQLRRIGSTKQAVADQLHVSREAVTLVSYNKRVSNRLRRALAETLGYESWEALIDAFERRKEGAA